MSFHIKLQTQYILCNLINALVLKIKTHLNSIGTEGTLVEMGGAVSLSSLFSSLFFFYLFFFFL